MKQVVYIDSVYGNDSFTGDLQSPVKTLAYGLSLVYEGGVIILQTGVYGSASIVKNITIRSAYGATPNLGVLTVTNAQVLLEGLIFSDPSYGVIVNNTNIGSVIIRECRFIDVETAVDINSAQYVSTHRNYFSNHKSGIKVTYANEICVSSNVFDHGARSINLSSFTRADVWGNTIYGASSISGVGTPNTNLRILYVTLTPFNISTATVQLPGFAALGIDTNYNVALNTLNGPACLYGTDYTVTSFGSVVSLLAPLMQVLSVGDVLRVMFAEDVDPGSGNAITLVNAVDPNTRVDSNSVTARIGVADIDLGVFITTPVKIRHNNFYRNTTWWSGAVPTGSTGLNNINTNPLYRDPVNSDFHLQYLGISGTSPNIDAADPGRWSNIYTEMFTGARSNVAPFDRNLDYDAYHRGVTGMVGTTGDIGALEYSQHETAMGNYVAERGYDISNPGTATGPYATIDRGYARASGNDLHIETNLLSYQVGVSGGYTGISHGAGYGRYYSKNIVLSGSAVTVGQATKNDIAYVYSSYPAYETGAVYVSVDRGTGVTGTFENPYRTVSDALTFGGGGSVFVKPGFYPSFKGVSGVHLSGVSDTRSVPLGREVYSDFTRGWTGPATYTGSKSTLTFLNDSRVLSKFTLGDTGPNKDIEFAFMVASLGNSIAGGLTDGFSGLRGSRNSVYAVLDKVNQRTVIGYTLGGLTGVSYEVAASYTGLFTDVHVRARIANNKFTVTMRSDDLDRTYSSVFSVTGLWRAALESYSTGVISDAYVAANIFRGATGSVSNTITRKKVFGILGTTGLQG
jgi:hypothetical protein